MGRFRFKQFAVDDDDASLKVGTDAVLVGAWCNVENAQRILDIGTGSGVIALMMAQRTSPDARIDAVEVNVNDANQARSNIMNSPWPGKIAVHALPIQEFSPDGPYDLIVCNPPYFSQSLHPPETNRAMARHDTQLTQRELLAAVDRLLAPHGIFSVILPAHGAEKFIGAAVRHGLHLTRHTRFFTRRHKPQERSLMSFSKTPFPFEEDSLLLYDESDRKSQGYTRLTGEFYL